MTRALLVCATLAWLSFPVAGVHLRAKRERPLKLRELHEENLAAHLDDIGCPLVKEVEADYPYLKALLEIMRSTKRPFFMSGGNTLALLRFGAAIVPGYSATLKKIKFDPLAWELSGGDPDFDFFVLSESDADREALITELKDRCSSAGFANCTLYHGRKSDMTFYYGKGNRTTFQADVFDLRQLNGTHMHIKNWGGEENSPWVFERDVLMPFAEAKYYDLRAPVAHDPMKFYSSTSPYHPEKEKNPEYGRGCKEMAYPSFLVPRLSDGNASLASTVQHDLKQCAQALNKHGFASFHECF